MSAPVWPPTRRLLAARAAWVLVTTLAVLAGAWLYQASRPVVYSSTAGVVLESAVAANTTPLAPAMGTEKEVAVSGVVLDLAAATLGTTERELSGRVSASVPPDANILDLQCTASKPEDAQRCAQTVADDYVAYRNNPARLADTPSARSSSPLRASVVTRAPLPTAPQRTSPVILLGIGLIAGLTLGVGTAYLRDRTDDRLRSPEDLKESAGIPVLPLIPRRARTDDLRALRVQLEGMVGRFHRLVVVVTAVGPRDDETMMATGLAVALARSGAHVVLVDAHVRAPRLHAQFGLSDFVGLTDLLLGGVSPEQTIQRTSVPRLDLIAAGVKDEDSPQLLVPDRLWSVLDQLRNTADVVVVDCPPVLAAPDAAAAGMGANAVLLLAELGRTKRAAVRRAAAQLAHPVNVLVAAVPIERHAGSVAWLPAAVPGATAAGSQAWPEGWRDADAAYDGDAPESADVDGDAGYAVEAADWDDEGRDENDYEDAQDDVEQEDGEQDGAPQDGDEQDGAQQDDAEQDGDEQDGAEQDGDEQDGDEQDGDEQHGAVQESTQHVFGEFRKNDGAMTSSNGVSPSDVKGVA